MIRALLIALSLAAASATARVDLVTVPDREQVQLTIYNSADLTLVRESRLLTLRNGLNRLQFSWSNTLIDPTSLAMTPLAQADQVDVFDLSFPPRVKDLGLWNIRSGIAGKVPMEITYLTSGLTWRAFYMGTLSPDEKTMRLQGYVRVTNTSGEDYEKAQTRLVVGKVHILDQIKDLAQRETPFGRPGAPVPWVSSSTNGASIRYEFSKLRDDSGVKQKAIVKEGLSEYFLYTIEGKETIPHGWSKRLPSFDTAEVPVVNLYKYDEEQFGKAPVRFLSFSNDEKHQLGETPIPGGAIKVYQTADEAAHLSYQGQSTFKYIPVDEEVELNLGAARKVSVQPVLMDTQTTNYEFKKAGGNISGWDEIHVYEVKVNNTRDLPVKVQIDRNFPSAAWTLEHAGDFGAFEKRDQDTVRFELELPPRSKKVFRYTLTTKHGSRAD